jgi:membrane-bound metal-dependent hydrolase YbcI (DUF457 family)
MIGSLLPDADIKTSFMGRILPLWKITKHRGMLHSLLGLVLFCLPLGILWDLEYARSLAFGYLVHLAMDAFSSIKWLGVRRKNRFRK